ADKYFLPSGELDFGQVIIVLVDFHRELRWMWKDKIVVVMCFLKYKYHVYRNELTKKKGDR
ncbi:MAG: hypothetical protein K8R19_05125, partial [Methanosarcinales archaeon]|nr:hypothetical protein [Methanosarcinales archaeon]